MMKRVKLIAAGVIAVLLIIVIVQNREPVETRRLDDRMPVAAEIAVAQVVAEHDDEVRALAAGRSENGCGPRRGRDARAHAAQKLTSGHSRHGNLPLGPA